MIVAFHAQSNSVSLVKTLFFLACCVLVFIIVKNAVPSLTTHLVVPVSIFNVLSNVLDASQRCFHVR